VLAGNVHADLHQLLYESVTAKIYGRYYINSFHFHSIVFLNLLVHWQPQLIHELLWGLLIQKGMNLTTTGLLKHNRV
jgi:hypothetical protein